MQVVPVVVGIRDVQVAGVFGAVAVAVADKRGFPMVVDVVVGEGDPVRGVGNVEKAIVVVFVVVPAEGCQSLS